MANIEKFCELLRKGNPTMTFEIESDSPYSGVKWICISQRRYKFY